MARPTLPRRGRNRFGDFAAIDPVIEHAGVEGLSVARDIGPEQAVFVGEMLQVFVDPAVFKHRINQVGMFLLVLGAIPVLEIRLARPSHRRPAGEKDQKHEDDEGFDHGECSVSRMGGYVR